MIRFHLRGVVREEESGIGIGGLYVKAYDKDLLFDDLLGTAYTGPDGSFDIQTERGDFRDFFERRPDLYLKIFWSDRETLLFDTKDAVRWKAGRYESFDVRIPRARLGDLAPKRGVDLLGEDGQPRTSFQAGESLLLHARGLRPSAPHQVTVRDDDGELFTDSLITNARGEIERTVIWPLLGIEDPRSNERIRVEDAREKWRGRKLRLTIRDAETTVGEATLDVEQELSRPLVVATDEEGFVRHGFEIGRGDARIGLYAFPRWEAARVFMVPRQHEWRPGDPILPVQLEGGRLAVADVRFDGDGAQHVAVANARELRPGAYDFVVRRLRYGYEDDDDLLLRPDDILGGRRTTGLVVREEFMASKVIRGGCTNVMQIAGRYLGIWPYMNYTDVFQTGENVYGALDPGALDPAHTGKMVAIYVIPHKTAAQWSMDSSLNHLAALGGNPATQKFLTQSWCTNANLRLLWPNATQVGEYDVVADFGNDTSNAMSFVQDDSYDMPLDIIDGYIATGFRIVPDPGVDTSIPFAGSFTYGEAEEGSLMVNDDFSSSWNVPLRAKVYFPADVPGATTVAQVSMAQSDYPLVIVVHGNSSVVDSYLGYDYLLEHLARNGFIAASVHCEVGMYATGRARVMRKHLEILFTRFGSRVANNVGTMGHSRGGEAVMTGAKLNNNEAWGYNINSVISLAPTDWILGDSLVGAWAPPVHVMYGSLDGDVAGIEDTGFELYDRASGMKKSMSFIYAACHDRFNTQWGDADFYFGQLGPADIARVISAAAHEAIAKSYMAAFFRQTLRGETQWEGIFKGEWVPASATAAAPGVKIYCQYEDTTVRTIDDFEEAHTATSWATSTIGGAVSQGGLPSTPQEVDLYPNDAHSPHSTSGLRLVWDGVADVLQWDVPGGQQDVSAFSALSFRITQVADSASNPASQPQDLRVTLTDGTATSRAIRVSKFTDIPYPDVREYNYYTKSALRTIRIPLTAYTILCLGVPQVDLTNVVNVKFEFAEKPAGEIAIDSVQFTN